MYTQLSGWFKDKDPKWSRDSKWFPMFRENNLKIFPKNFICVSN